MLTFALDKTHLFPILPRCGVNIVQHQWTFSLRISANDLWFIETSDTIPNKWMCRRAFANRQASGEEPYKKLRHSVSKPKTAHWLYTATRWLSGQPVVIGCCDIVVALLPLLTTSSCCSLVLNCRQLAQCTKNRHTQQSAAIGCGVVRDNYLPAPPLWWGALSSSLSQEAIETVVPTRTAASKKIFMYLFMMSFVLRGEYSDLLYRMRRWDNQRRLSLFYGRGSVANNARYRPLASSES